jgi:hypothetical protein
VYVCPSADVTLTQRIITSAVFHFTLAVLASLRRYVSSHTRMVFQTKQVMRFSNLLVQGFFSEFSVAGIRVRVFNLH